MALAATILFFFLWRAPLELKALFLIALLGGVNAIMANDNRPIPEENIRSQSPDGKFTALVEVLSLDSTRPRGVRYIVRVISVNGGKAEGLLRWNARQGNNDDSRAFLPGDELLITGAKYRRPHGFRNIHGWDYDAYLKDRELDGDFLVSSQSRIVKIDTLSNWRRPLERLRGKLGANLRSADPLATALNMALILGDDGLITPEIRQAFSRAGTAHILSVSGLHIGFIAASCFFAVKLLAFVLMYPSRQPWVSAGVPVKIAAIAALLAATLYAALTGFKFPALRSAIMIDTYLVAVALGRGREFYNAFALALMAILLIFPWALFDVGFQLSFMAVFFISAFMEGWWKPLFAGGEPGAGANLAQKALRLAPLLGSFLAVSFSATLGTAPLVAHYFNTVTLYGFMSNAVVVPLASLATPWGMVWAFGGPEWARAVTDFLTRLVAFISEWSAALPYSYKHVGHTPALAWAFYYLFMLILLIAPKNFYKKLALAVTATGFAAILLLTHYLEPEEEGLTVRFVDVGQGDCALVTWPGGAMAIDAGPRFETFDPGRSVIAPILWAEQKLKLTAMLATHDDADHIGGMPGLLESVPADMFLDNGLEKDVPKPIVVLREKMRAGGVYRALKTGDFIDFPDGPSIRVLSPPPGPLPFDEESNDRCLAFILEYRGRKVFFAGDISKEVERWLISSGMDIRADAIKLAHHGSDTSTSKEFLKAVGAKTGVISVGFMNRHRHPSKKTLERLEEAGMRVFRTDMDGEIVLRTDGRKMRFESYSSSKAAR
ncbi:MAG: DNA internalization-related competence protein ComEC/Rec2 [Nitrospinae bacterium]|nr:DNA internalization-related competence protein ComEC/Rec2 [Nitrospinota bacterium]